MTKAEFRGRLKRIGLNLKDVAIAGGISIDSVYNWKKAPGWAIWWLRYREALYYIERAL